MRIQKLIKRNCKNKHNKNTYKQILDITKNTRHYKKGTRHHNLAEYEKY